MHCKQYSLTLASSTALACIRSGAWVKCRKRARPLSLARTRQYALRSVHYDVSNVLECMFAASRSEHRCYAYVWRTLDFCPHLRLSALALQRTSTTVQCMHASNQLVSWQAEQGYPICWPFCPGESCLSTFNHFIGHTCICLV